LIQAIANISGGRLSNPTQLRFDQLVKTVGSYHLVFQRGGRSIGQGANQELLPKALPLHIISRFVCSNMAFNGDFTPVLAKHTKSFNLIDTLAVGVDRIQRNFEPLQRQVELWRKTQVSDERAKLIFYNAFFDGALDAPRALLSEVHRLYFEPEYPEFSARTMWSLSKWSLSNAFTSAFKKLNPIPQFKATAKLGGFLAQLPA
jgi:hypothetical protein